VPSEAIYRSAERGEGLDERHLATWPVWSGEKPSGTAMIVLDVYPELRCWVEEDRPGDTDANAQVKELLERSLMGFVDPYEPPDERPTFRYAFSVHADSREREIVSYDQGVTRADVIDMEHAIVGTFDEYGCFRGEVRAFGRPWVAWTFTPQKPLSQVRSGRVGPFSLILGTFELDPRSTSHEPERHTQLCELAEQYGGFLVYRDHLRLQPYGRPDNDLFRIEYRRSKHAGREFWSHRRMFGRVALTRDGNDNLRDKAGREGLIENTAMRRFRGLVEDFLMAASRRFFGTDSTDRKPALAEIQQRNEERAQAAERRHNRLNHRDFTRALRVQEPALRSATERVASLRQRLDAARAAQDGEQVRAIGEELEAERAIRSSLQLPMRPHDLGTFEADWRTYRDDLAEMSAALDGIARIHREAMDALRPEAPEDTAHKAFGRHQKLLHDQLRRWQIEAKKLLTAEIERLDARVDDDRAKYYAQAAPIAARAAEVDVNLAAVLDGLETARDQIEESLQGYYPTYIRALQRLADGIDLDSALQWSADERTRLESRLTDVTALAQLGIAFEIIGHEFHEMQRDVMSNLRRLPLDVQGSEAFRGAMNAWQALSRRLKFFTPLQMAGRVTRERVTGDEIGRYVESFFGDYFARERIAFQITPAFKNFVITEHRWRIYPVFINLLQNARYWVRQSERARVIMLDRQGDAVIIADSGPGIDPDDGEAIFDLFFSRRRGGRGVGLYLVRVNLAAGRHRIELAMTADDSHHILPGANFVIRFEGIKHDA
jgi:signal transduction histidine kinase